MKLEEKGLRVGEKQLKVPIIQGGMGVGISLGRLAGSVAKEGAVGIISAAQIGYQEPDFDTDARKANLRAIGKEMEKARAISPDGIIGFNIMVAMRHYEDYVREAVCAGTDLIISGCRPSDRTSEICGREQRTDCTDCLYGKISESHSEILG